VYESSPYPANELVDLIRPKVHYRLNYSSSIRWLLQIRWTSRTTQWRHEFLSWGICNFRSDYSCTFPSKRLRDCSKFKFYL